MSAHIDPAQLLMLAAMSDDDPERAAALAHVATCQRCRAALDESAAVLQLLDLGQPSVQIEPALKARIERSVWRPRGLERSQLLAFALAVVSLVLVWKNGPALAHGVVRPGLGCAAFESGFALVPLVVGGVLSRFGRVRLSPARFASYTMAFAVGGQLVLRGHCAAHDLSLHLFVFHFLVVLLAGVVGAGAARWLAART